MPVTAGTIETFTARNMIREDLQEAYSMISPEETPFQQAIRQETVDNTLFEWPVVTLAAPGTNRVMEAENAPPNDTGTLAVRLSNQTQISDKVVEVSHTAQAVNAAAANVQRLAEQVVLKIKEMKRDMEMMLLDNTPALAGSSGTARQTAGLPAFLRTNTSFVAGGANPTLSGGTEGFPNAGATAGTTPVVFAESRLNDVIQSCWNEGAQPSLIMVNAGNKRRISQAFIGNATRYKDTIDQRVVNSIDFYTSDFGELTVVPNRFMRTNNFAGANNSFNVFVIDPQYAALAFLDPMQQKPLAETGHSLRTLVWAEYGLQIDNERAHGIIRDTTNLTT